MIKKYLFTAEECIYMAKGLPKMAKRFRTKKERKLILSLGNKFEGMHYSGEVHLKLKQAIHLTQLVNILSTEASGQVVKIAFLPWWKKVWYRKRYKEIQVASIKVRDIFSNIKEKLETQVNANKKSNTRKRDRSG